MNARTVCNLKVIMACRFICGVGKIFKDTPKLLCIVFKLQPILVALMIMHYAHNKVTKISPVSKYFTCIEYFVHFVVAVQTEDKYIYKYFEYMDGIDNLPGAKKIYKRLSICVIVVIITLTMSKIFSICIFCNTLSHVCYDDEIIGVITMSIMWFAVDICRATLIYIFTLLYCRTKLVRMSLEIGSDWFENPLIVDYTQKYMMLMDSLKKIDYPLQILVCVVFFQFVYTYWYSFAILINF